VQNYSFASQTRDLEPSEKKIRISKILNPQFKQRGKNTFSGEGRSRNSRRRRGQRISNGGTKFTANPTTPPLSRSDCFLATPSFHHHQGSPHRHYSRWYVYNRHTVQTTSDSMHDDKHTSTIISNAAMQQSPATSTSEVLSQQITGIAVSCNQKERHGFGGAV